MTINVIFPFIYIIEINENLNMFFFRAVTLGENKEIEEQEGRKAKFYYTNIKL